MKSSSSEKSLLNFLQLVVLNDKLKASFDRNIQFGCNICDGCAQLILQLFSINEVRSSAQTVDN